MRALIILFAGGVLGAIVAGWLATTRDGVALDDALSHGTIGREPLDMQRDRPESTPDLLDVDDAARADFASLERDLARVAGEPWSHRGERTTSALLARMAELDVERAVSAALALGLERAHLYSLFRRWAELEPTAALDALGRIDNPGLARGIALALLEVVGDDRRGIERLARILPAIDRVNFEVAALVDRVKRDPADALQAALAIDDPAVRDSAITQVGRAWADENARDAIAHLELIPDLDQRTAFFNIVLTRWARLEPSAALQYAITADEHYLSASMFAVRTIANRVPAEVLAAANRLPPRVRQQIEAYAADALGERDPVSALAAAETLPPGQLRQVMFTQAAMRWAQRDARAAFAWAQSRELAPNILAAIVSSAAQVAPEQAMDYVFATGAQATLVQSLVTGARQRPELFTELADRVVARSELARAVLPSLLSAWASASPESALDWALAHESTLDSGSAQQLAYSTGSGDADAAMRAGARVPPELQDEWLGGVAAAMAARDPAGAASWITRYRGRPGYDEAFAVVVQRFAMTDAAAAAKMVDEASGPSRLTAARAVARYWADSNPAAAASWAEGLADTEMRKAVIEQVAQAWTTSDSAGARRWMLRMDRGPLRDTALTAFLVRSASALREEDERLFDAFGSAAARDEAARAAAVEMARRGNPDRAAALVERHIADVDRRAEAERAIETARRQSGLIPFPR